MDSTSSPDESNGAKTDSDVAVHPPTNNGEDILAALEKIPGVGSLRSVGNSSIGSSLPSLSLENQARSVKREESSFSLKSQTAVEGGQVKEIER